jgi:conjugative transfer signal peptidase TraF
MKRSQRVRVAAMGAVLALAVSVIGASVNRKLVLYNHTPSVPIGWYVYAGRSPKVGDIVAFTLPTAAHDYARSRGDPIDVRLLKHVLAAAGDRVSTSDGELRVNGVSFGTISVIDTAGRTLPSWQADRVLIDDELLVGSATGHSFDSRFFGPVHAAQVQGVYRRLIVGSTNESSPEPTQSCTSLRIGVASTMPHR